MNNEKVASENPFTWAYLNAKYAKLKCSQYTETRKNMNLPYLIRMHWTNFWHHTVHAPQNIFEKTLIEVGISHIYASFGMFCVQIGQLFEARWVFEKGMKTVKSLFSNENDVDFGFFQKFKVSLRLD